MFMLALGLLATCDRPATMLFDALGYRETWVDTMDLLARGGAAALVVVQVVQWFSRACARMLLLGLGLLVVTYAAGKLPGLLGFEGTALESALWWALVLLWAWLAAKVTVMLRFTAIALHRRAPASELKPLPSQLALIAPLIASIESAPADSGELVPVAGLSGSGKSVVLSFLQDHFDDRAQWVVLTLNVWRNDSSQALGYDLLRKLLAAPWLVRHCGHLYPARLALTMLMGILRELIRRVGFKMGDSEVEILPGAPMQWQDQLERCISIATRAGKRVLVILDEAERANPQKAQEAVTLTHRALQLPGVVVVFSYVRDRMAYKAFHPLLALLDDLRSHIFATIYAFFDEHSMDTPEPLGGMLPPAWQDDLGHAFGSRHAEATGNPSGAEKGAETAARHAAGRALIEHGLARQYLMAPKHVRDVLIRRIEEKYFAHTVAIPKLTAIDVCAVCETEIRKRQVVSPSDLEIWKATMQRGLAAHLVAHQPRTPNLRSLVGTWRNMLVQYQVAPPEADAPTFLAALAVVASHIAIQDDR
jgi:hypothetical protein